NRSLSLFPDVRRWCLSSMLSQHGDCRDAKNISAHLVGAAERRRFRETGRYGTSRGIAYIGLMLAARITLPHFSVSSAMNFPNSAEVINVGLKPMSRRRTFT